MRGNTPTPSHPLETVALLDIRPSAIQRRIHLIVLISLHIHLRPRVLSLTPTFRLVALVNLSNEPLSVFRLVRMLMILILARRRLGRVPVVTQVVKPTRSRPTWITPSFILQIALPDRIIVSRLGEIDELRDLTGMVA